MNGPRWMLAKAYERHTDVTVETVRKRLAKGVWQYGREAAETSFTDFRFSEILMRGVG